MMRAARERPRVAVATALGAILVIAVSVALGALIAGGSASVPEPMRVRLASAESTARDQARALQTARLELSESKAATARLKQRLHELGANNARLRAALVKARRPGGRKARRSGPPANDE